MRGISAFSSELMSFNAAKPNLLAAPAVTWLVAFMINDSTMQAKLKATSKHMQGENGPLKAAGILDQLVKTGKYDG